jgi:hypothetical protein
VVVALAQALEQAAVGVEAPATRAQHGLVDALAGAVHRRRTDGLVDEVALEGVVVLEVALALALLHFVEGRLRDVEVAALHELAHLPVEEREQQRADVAAVDVGVGHQDDLVVARLLGVELILADAGAEGGDQRRDLLRRQHLVEAGLLDVQDLAAQGQDGLGATVAAALGRATGRVTLDDVQLGGAGSFSWQSASLPGRPMPSRAPLRRVSSRALRAASRARAASMTLPVMFLASPGFSSNHAASGRRHGGSRQRPSRRRRRACLGLRAELGVGHLDADDGA